MKLRRRFKKALFAFFKQEILKEVGVDVSSHHSVFEHKTVDYSELVADISLVEQNYPMRTVPFEAIYEDALRNAKAKLFDEVMKHVIIDSKSILQQFAPVRKIRLRLFIGKIKDS